MLTLGTYLTIGAPLLGAILIALGGTRLNAKAASWLGCLAVLVAFAGAVIALLTWHDHTHIVQPYTWLSSGSFHVGMSFQIDALSIFEMLVVTGVGFLIHVYSVGYMDGDPQQRRFFAYLNVFIFSMLMLVMAANFVLLLVGWGLVGMASYLLIGFWHERPSAVAAAKKAFIMNAVGDVSLMLGLFLAFERTHQLSYQGVFAALPHVVGQNSGTSAAICLLLLGGAVAKSAQLPLHTWLPDAMEGPTPVSALIHAATMVTAGVYLVARMGPVFDLSHVSQDIVALIGALTLVTAGFLALVQTDIKRVIAYSTMSQIGYMFVAVGVGAYGAGMFHLMTHAFFKALLFLAAGVIIHALDGEQDIRAMGGLRKHMPVTYGLFLAASLALAGIIPFAGFFSKDAILGSDFAAHSELHAVAWVVWGLGLLGVLLTGLYTFRLLFLVFHGEEGTATTKLAEHGHHGRGEGPITMMLPILVLGVGTVISGLLVIPGAWDVVGNFLKHAGSAPPRAGLHEVHAGTEWLLSLAVSLPLALIGIFVASMIWLRGSWSGLRTRFDAVAPALRAGLGFDRFYDLVFTIPAAAVARAVRSGLERGVFSAVPGWTATAARDTGAGLGVLQSGLVRMYAALTTLAVLGVVIWFLVAR